MANTYVPAQTFSYSTKPPTGISISRSGSKFTVTWKIGDNNYKAGHQFRWRIYGSDGYTTNWTTKGLTAKDTSETVTIDFSKFFPTTKKMIWYIYVEIRGKRETETKKRTTTVMKKTTVKSKKKGGGTLTQTTPVKTTVTDTYKYAWSDWNGKQFVFQPPNNTSISASVSGEYSNLTTFSWNVTNDTTSHKHFADCFYQTILVRNDNIGTGAAHNWANNSQNGNVAGEFKNGTTGASGSISIKEDSARLANDSYTRWVRVKARGAQSAPGDESTYRYAKHVYATPYQAKIDSTTATLKTAKNGFNCTVKWTSTTNLAHPIDNTSVEWGIGVPTTSFKCPSDISWTEPPNSPILDTTKKDGLSFGIDEILGDDECLFVRVNNRHDKNITYGQGTLVKGGVGYLANPTLTNVNLGTDMASVRVTATNNSQIKDGSGNGAFLAVYYKPASAANKPVIVGIIKNNTTTSEVLKTPNFSKEKTVTFGVKAFLGSYTAKKGANGVTQYTISANMESKGIVWLDSAVPIAPTNVTANTTPIVGTVRVTWDWTWADADSAELSWADHEDAWESTEEPSTYRIDKLQANAWNISGLETGKTWYIRVRLINITDDSESYGAYSVITPINLASAPTTPSLYLSDGVITKEGIVTASWAYTTTDGTRQAYAEICEATISGTGIKYGRVIARTQTAQHIDLRPTSIGWKVGNTYNLCVRVTSGSGLTSDNWSDPVSVTIADPLNCEISETSLVEENIEVNATTYTYEVTEQDEKIRNFKLDANLFANTVSNFAVGQWTLAKNATEDGEWALACNDDVEYINSEELPQHGITLDNNIFDDDWEEIGEITFTVEEKPLTRKATVLKGMPLKIKVRGAGAGGVTTVAVERAESYHMARPDETDFAGNQGETVAIISQDGDNEIVINTEDLISALDDGALYRIVATVKDNLGQSAEASLTFEVRWQHQALIPTANIEIDEDNYIAKITPIAPEGSLDTDTCDIYRLNADRPELIYKGAEWGKTYIDPYPAIGSTGGHRIVLRTANGDYITADKQPAWTDYGENEDDVLFTNYTLIDFEGRTIHLFYNVDYSSQWEKDFKETVYLGGAVQGDWNKGIRRSGSVSSLALTLTDIDVINDMRKLAAYPGICHIRTQDGSSYACDIQVAENRVHDDQELIVSFSLTVTRVDTEGFDGLTLEQWEEGQDELE